jgi:ribosome-associated protein
VTRRKRPVAGEAPAPAGRPANSFAEFVYSVLDEKRAADIVWLDVSAITDLADDFLIATIQNQRQGAAIVDACEKERKRRGLPRVGIEGEAGSSWILLDYADLVVHLLLPEQRQYYGLEHIWADAVTVTSPGRRKPGQA